VWHLRRAVTSGSRVKQAGDGIVKTEIHWNWGWRWDLRFEKVELSFGQAVGCRGRGVWAGRRGCSSRDACFAMHERAVLSQKHGTRLLQGCLKRKQPQYVHRPPSLITLRQSWANRGGPPPILFKNALVCNTATCAFASHVSDVTVWGCFATQGVAGVWSHQSES